MEQEKNLEDKLSVFEKITYGMGSIFCVGGGAGAGMVSYGFMTEAIHEYQKHSDYVNAGFLMIFGTFTGALAVAGGVGATYLLAKVITSKNNL